MSATEPSPDSASTQQDEPTPKRGSDAADPKRGSDAADPDGEKQEGGEAAAVKPPSADTPTTDTAADSAGGGGGRKASDDDKMTGTQRLAALKQKKQQKRAEELQAIEAEEDADEEEEVQISLLDRTDSELTPGEILQKDLMLYDLLMEHEELMMMPGELKVEAPPEEEEEEEPEEEHEGDEEDEEEEEEAVDTGEAAPEVEAEHAPVDNPDDPDNIVNLMMQDQADVDDALKLLFMDAPAPEPETDSIVNFPGVVGITLSDKSKEFFEIGDLAEKDPNYTYISFKRIKLHLYMYQDKSEFAPHYELFKHYPDFAMLLGVDATQQTGHPYYLCTTIESRNLVINPPKRKKVVQDVKKKEEEVWAKMASIVPRKWRTLGSELEVEAETVKDGRPLLTVYAYRYLEGFGEPIEFETTPMEPDSMAYASFPSVDPATIKLIEESEVDVGIQVMPPKTTSSSQTGFSFKRNKIIQYESQYLPPEEAQEYLDLPVEIKKTKALQRSLLQNELMSMTADDYKSLKAVKGHEVEYNNESVLLQEYQTYCDLRHSKGRYVTCMAFHPTLEDVVVMSVAEPASFDRRIEFHSKMLMEPNFVLFWDLKDPVRPQLMLDAPADVFTFMVNPADSSLVAGGCANGQIVLWDLGRLHSELRARIQDRRHKSSDQVKRRPSFLEKLKDNAEKYVCPLVPVAGLSNLDQSHKKVVTSVCWLPPHVELGKNGTLYESSTGGKSVQFFSSAGDGTLRLWDIRPSKLGLDEFDSTPDQDIIRSNMWAHLENNSWKYSAKYMLDDGSGTMYSTVMSISEPKQGDVIKFDTGHRGSVLSDTSGLNLNVSSKDLNKTASGNIPTTPQKSAMKLEGSGSQTQARTGSITESGPGVDVEAISAASRRAAGMLNVLSTAQTSIFVGTELGQTILCDWLRNKDGTINQEQGQRVCQNVFLETVHDGAITCINRSPFYNNLILVVGGGSVSIWKENSAHPLLATAGSEYFPWCGCWSNTRPAVFFVGTLEGALEVWDLTEKSHSPVLVQQISPEKLTNCSIPKPKLAKKQILALSDAAGNLFVMLLSRYYYKPTQFENSFMQELMNRDEKRLQTWISEAEEREETIRTINSKFKESRIIKKPDEISAIVAEDEVRLRLEFDEYDEFQQKMGARLKRDEPSVSTSSFNLAEDFSQLLEAAKEKDQELRDAGELSDDHSATSLGSDYDFLDLKGKKGHDEDDEEGMDPDDDDYDNYRY